MSRTVIILGSSRRDGDTKNKVENLQAVSDWDTIDLNDYRISYYDYSSANRDDDFIPLMKDILQKYDTLIFATPVYWYAMSGILKVFFDRITDLLTIEKELGRQFRGKSMGVLSCSNGNNLDDAFWLPFSKTAEYLGMHYLGNLHTNSKENDLDGIRKFVGEIVSRS